MNFSQNLKAFLKQLPLNKMSGQQKFLAVAPNLSQGDITTEIATQDVRQRWRKSILSIAYNPSFYDRAQGAGWVDPTGMKGKFRVAQAGLDNLEALVPEFTAGEVKKSGSLTIFGSVQESE